MCVCVCVRGQGFNAARFKSLSNSKFLVAVHVLPGSLRNVVHSHTRAARARARALCCHPPCFAKDSLRNPVRIVRGGAGRGGLRVSAVLLFEDFTEIVRWCASAHKVPFIMMSTRARARTGPTWVSPTGFPQCFSVEKFSPQNRKRRTM